MNKYYVTLKIVEESHRMLKVKANTKEEAELKAKELANSTFCVFYKLEENTTIETMRVTECYDDED